LSLSFNPYNDFPLIRSSECGVVIGSVDELKNSYSSATMSLDAALVELLSQLEGWPGSFQD